MTRKKETRTTSVVIYVTDYRKLKAKLALEGRSVSQFLREKIKEYIS